MLVLLLIMAPLRGQVWLLLVSLLGHVAAGLLQQLVAALGQSSLQRCLTDAGMLQGQLAMLLRCGQEQLQVPHNRQPAHAVLHSLGSREPLLQGALRFGLLVSSACVCNALMCVPGCMHSCRRGSVCMQLRGRISQ